MKSPADTAPPDLLPVAVLGRAHGVRGEIALRLYNPDSDLFGVVELPLPLMLRHRDQAARPAVLVGVRPAGDHLLVSFEGVDDRDQAVRLTNAEVLVERDRLGPLDDDEFYIEDLIGCAVTDQDDQPRGTAAGVFWNGAHHVLAVVQDGRETLLPAVAEFILDLDVEGRRLQMRFLEEDVAGDRPQPSHARRRRDRKAARGPRHG